MVSSGNNNGDKQSVSQCSGKRIAVVGAGVSGLAAAYKLKLHGLDVIVYEAEERAGGKLRTISRDGLIWDEGANTMTESDTEVGYVLDNLRLREKQQFPLSQSKRYIARNGTPVMIPSDPIALVRSNFLSAQSKLQIMLEPFLWKKKDPTKVNNADESVGAFFQRHFGKEVVDYLIDPFVAGSSAADPDSLSVRHAFPELWNIEEKFGSLILGAVKSKFASKPVKGVSPTKKKLPRGSFSFSGGMQTLTDAMCKALGRDEIKLQSEVLSLSYNCSENSLAKKWAVSSASARVKQSEEDHFDAVIMTAPLYNVKELKITRKGIPFLLDFLPEVTFLPLSVIITAFKKEKVKKPLEGFGVLIPAKEQKNGLKTLGTLFSSMMFPDRAPSDSYLYTTFVGGSRNKELAKASTEELKEIVTCDLKQLLGAEGEPASIYHYYWSKAFPLYGHNYDAVIESIKKMEENLPGFFYAGNQRGGLSVGKSLSSGCKAADLVISYLESCSKDDNSEDISC